MANTANIEISFFDNIYHNDKGTLTTIDEFLGRIKFGTWKEQTLAITSQDDAEDRAELKKKILPYVTISGKFGRRVKTELVKHSGFICIDFDKLDSVEATFSRLKDDPYTYAIFRSVSGRGLAVLVRIDGRKHLDAYLGLETYYANKYQEITDRSCKDTTRPRFVSFDPNLHINEGADKFTSYLPKTETQKKLPTVITGKNDMDYLLTQVKDNGIDLTGGVYFRYLEIGFALAHEYRESGREYFHFIASYSSKYNQEVCDKQYDKCLKSGGEGVTIATLLYHAKNAGLQIMSPETKTINTLALGGRNAGRSLDDTIDFINEVHGISPDISTDLVTKIYSTDKVNAESKLSTIESLELFIQDNYTIKRNEITRFIQNDGVDIDSVFMNSVYFRARKEIDDKIRFEEIERLIYSDHTKNWNPIKEFFEQSSEEDDRTIDEIIRNGYIKQLADSIETDTGDPSYKYHVLTKWTVGVVGSVYGTHSVLTFVFTGGMGTGKTEFFRRFLPPQLKEYYAESKLEAGKDDELLMTQKLIIMDDEFGGKNKMESKRFKELTSKEAFTLREPYGRKNVTIRRLASLAGTSNDDMVLSDPTGNRRIIPIRILSINHEKYNAVDKAKVLREAYRLMQLGYTQYMDKDDVASLNEHTGEFNTIRSEAEHIAEYLRLPGQAGAFSEDVEFVSASYITAYLNKMTGEKMFPNKVGVELKAAGFEKVKRERNFRQIWGYFVVFVKSNENLYKSNNQGPSLFSE